jgi:lipopolysaccharide-induced tumor necrosis factor-alpha factor
MASPQYTAEQPQYHTEQPAMQPIQEKNYPQQGLPEQPMAQQPMPANNFASATPLVSLQQGPAPVDCPVCRVRQMTRVEFVSGGTTM